MTDPESIQLQPEGEPLPPDRKTGRSRLDEMPSEAITHSGDPTRQVQQYILVDKIGKGGTGSVWKAWDRKLTRWVAIKFLHSAEPETLQRFQREAKLAARLRHPNIAPIYEVGELAGSAEDPSPRPFLVMEFIDGRPFGADTLPLRQVLEIFVKVAQGVEAAHRSGIIHRDLKPANIMLTKERWPYVMDFGLAKSLQVESNLSLTGAVMGTPNYMSPEQAAGEIEKIDARTDVYSLGATLYAIAARAAPYSGKGGMDVLMKVLMEPPPPPRERNPEIPEEVEKIILRAMARNKEERYPSAGAMADDIQRYLRGLEIEDAPTVLTSSARQFRPRRWPLAVGGVALVAIGLFAYLGSRPRPLPVVVPEPPAPVVAPASNDEQWLEGWVGLRTEVDYGRWQPGDATLLTRVRDHFGTLPSPAARREALDWIDNQVERARADFDRMRQAPPDARRERAARLASWCGLVIDVARGVELLKASLGPLGALRDEAAALAAYRGKFTLMLAVEPFAEVTRIAREGKEVKLPSRHTPLVVSDLEIGDYEVELTHPGFKKKTVRLRAGELKDGKTTSISGRMSGDTLNVAGLP